MLTATFSAVFVWFAAMRTTIVSADAVRPAAVSADTAWPAGALTAVVWSDVMWPAGASTAAVSTGAAIANGRKRSSCRSGHDLEVILWPKVWHLLHFGCAFGRAAASTASNTLGSL